jgi:Ca-activated chloride channel family protein
LPGPEGYGGAFSDNLQRIQAEGCFPDGFSGLDYFVDLIHTELRNQYLLGYAPTNRARDGKWRQVTVKLDAPRGFPKLSVRAKKGYFAPPN